MSRTFLTLSHLTMDNMPFASIGGILCDVLFNPKYAGGVYTITVAIDSIGNIVCWPPGHRRMFTFGIAKGPKDARNIIWIMMDYEIGSMDGA